MRALFVGGAIDNAELDMDENTPPKHYPKNTGAGHSRYNLHHVGQRNGGEIAYAVYGAPDLASSEVKRVAAERDYARRFEAEPQEVA